MPLSTSSTSAYDVPILSTPFPRPAYIYRRPVMRFVRAAASRPLPGSAEAEDEDLNDAYGVKSLVSREKEEEMERREVVEKGRRRKIEILEAEGRGNAVVERERGERDTRPLPKGFFLMEVPQMEEIEPQTEPPLEGEPVETELDVPDGEAEVSVPKDLGQGQESDTTPSLSAEIDERALSPARSPPSSSSVSTSTSSRTSSPRPSPSPSRSPLVLPHNSSTSSAPPSAPEPSEFSLCPICSYPLSLPTLALHSSSTIHQLALSSSSLASPSGTAAAAPSTPAYGLKRSSVGWGLLASMGWTEGKGLGREEGGRKVPLEARVRRGGAGVGVVVVEREKGKEVVKERVKVKSKKERKSEREAEVKEMRRWREEWEGVEIPQ